MQLKSRAIVLRTVKYGDSQWIVDLLTEEAGRMSCICTIPHSGRGKIKKQFFQPLHLLDLVVTCRSTASLQRLADVRLQVPLVSIPVEPSKLAIALFVAEFLCYATRGERQNSALYDYVSNSILWLDGASQGYSNFHLVFMMRLSRFLGFWPNLDNYAEGKGFDLREGMFVDSVPLHKDYVEADEAARIVPLMRMNYATMHLYRMNRKDRNRCVEWLLHFYRLHIPDFPELRSWLVLRELYASN